MALNASSQLASVSFPRFRMKTLSRRRLRQAVDLIARLVGQPFLIHVVVDPRKRAHDFAATRIDPDIAANRVHHVDA